MPTPSEMATRLPGETLDSTKMPAHWLFARLGKRVLRPGGRELTELLLRNLDINAADRVVEMAPGLGATTRLLIQPNPKTYTGIERDPDAVAIVNTLLVQPEHECRAGTAQATGLPHDSADIVFGEAYLSMQPESTKQQIISEAFRILDSGGRFSLHELALHPDTMPEDQQEELRSDFAKALHVGARPLTIASWKTLLENAGFEIEFETTVPFRLLHPQRVIADEGWARSLRIFAVAITQPAIRRRMGEIRECFKRHEHELCAVGIIARKP